MATRVAAGGRMVQERKLSAAEAIEHLVRYTKFHAQAIASSSAEDLLAQFIIEKNAGVDQFSSTEKKTVKDCHCPDCDPDLYRGHNLEMLRAFAKKLNIE